ncbi:MAG: NHL repeat-containing protein, partial [Planctomycetota bacterium]
KFSTSTIDAANFDAATTYTQSWAPQAAGNSENFTATGLTVNQTYYFALKVADEVPNISVISNVPSVVTGTGDSIPPSAITDLSVSTGVALGALDLSWTATGDDGNVGTASSYLVKYSTSTITAGNFDSATTYSQSWTPLSSSSTENRTMTGLTGGQIYYVAIKVLDEVPNTSLISNVANGVASAFAGFVKTWGGSVDEYATGIGVDSTGNIYCSVNTASFGAGSGDIALLKYSSSGSLQWAKTWGGSGIEYAARKVVVDSGGNIYCAGVTDSFGAGGRDAFLLKYDSSGTLQWARTWGSTSHEQSDFLEIDSSGNIYCASRTSSFGAGGDDTLLLKYNSSGSLQWAKTWGGSGTEHFWSNAIDSSGNSYCVGFTESYGAGGRDIILVKYDVSGAIQWARTWGGAADDTSSGVAVDLSGNVYCNGSTRSFGAGNWDRALLKYDGSGVLQWAKTWGGGAGDAGHDVRVGSNGNIYTVGWTVSFGAGSYDGLVLKYDTSGGLQWAKTWGGILPELLYGIHLNSDGSLYVAGTTDTYSGAWQTITAGTVSTPTGTQTTPSGTVTSPSGTVGSPSGTETIPAGIETGGGGKDTLLVKGQQ